MSLRTSFQRGLAALLLCVTPHLVAAQTTTGPGAPDPFAPAELFGRDELGFDTPYQTLAQTFLPFVGGGTVGYLQNFTVYMQAADYDLNRVPTFTASIWSINSGPTLSLNSVLRTSSGPTGSDQFEGWKAITFDFSSLQLSKNVTYAFVLAMTGYASAEDGTINYVAMNDDSPTGAAFGAMNGSSAVDGSTTWSRLQSFDQNTSRTLAYTATFTTSTVPEPSTIVLLSLGLGVMLLLVRRRTA